MIRVELPIKLVSTANRREHWTARAKRSKAERELAYWTLIQAHGRGLALPPPPYRVLITRFGGRKMDSDNFAIACKAIRDGVAQWLGIDDGSSAITWAYAQTDGKPARVSIEVTKGCQP